MANLEKEDHIPSNKGELLFSTRAAFSQIVVGTVNSRRRDNTGQGK